MYLYYFLIYFFNCHDDLSINNWVIENEIIFLPLDDFYYYIFYLITRMNFKMPELRDTET